MDDLKRKFRQWQELTDERGSMAHPPLDIFFTDEFIQRHSRFATIDEFLEAGGFHIQSKEDLERISGEEIDAHVVAHTDFQSGEEMFKAAMAEWAKKTLGLG